MINYKLMHSFTRNILRWCDDKAALITLHGPLLAQSKARCEAVFSSGMLASQAFSMGVMFMFNHKMPLNNPLWFRSFVTSQKTIPFILYALQLHFKTRSGGIEGGGYPTLKALFNLCVGNLWIISVYKFRLRVKTTESLTSSVFVLICVQVYTCPATHLVISL